jgi:hypothetical protein
MDLVFSFMASMTATLPWGFSASTLCSLDTFAVCLANEVYPLHAILTNGRFVPQSVRTLVDFLMQKFQG